MKTSLKLDCQSCSSRLLGALCSLDKAGVDECNEHKTTGQYRKGEIIFYETNAPNGVYCIFSGRIKLYKTGLDGRQQIVRIAGAGDLLGYRSIFAEEPYSTTAQVIEDATICCIDKNSFFSFLSNNPDFSSSIIKKLSKELRNAEDLATSIAHRTVRERMAELLVILQTAYGKPEANGTRIHLQLSREEMAEMIGVTQETAIRLLSEFRNDGITEVKERDITILDVGTLMETAGLE